MAPGEHDEVLGLGPLGIGTVEPRHATVHASAGCVGEAEPAVVAGVEGEPAIAVGVQLGAEGETDEAVVAHRCAAQIAAVVADVRELVGLRHVVGTGEVPGVAAHRRGVVVATFDVRREHTRDRRALDRRLRCVGAMQAHPVELDVLHACRAAATEDLEAHDGTGPGTLLARERVLQFAPGDGPVVGEVEVLDRAPDRRVERQRALLAERVLEANRHAEARGVGAEPERGLRVQPGVDRIGPSVMTPRQDLRPVEQQADRRAVA